MSKHSILQLYVTLCRYPQVAVADFVVTRPMARSFEKATIELVRMGETSGVVIGTMSENTQTFSVSFKVCMKFVAPFKCNYRN